MINWRSISEVGNPTKEGKYLVTDGKDISTTEAHGITRYSTESKTFQFREWVGDDNTWEDNSCCSGTKMFGMTPTHWCPLDELNLP